MILCIGPEGSGKTLLIKRLITQEKDLDEKTLPTVGVNLYKLIQNEGKNISEIHIRELGGSMSPIWHNYYQGVRKVLFVVDAINMIQVGAFVLQFLKLITHKNLEKAEVALVFNKIDCPLPRSTKELLGIMRMDEIKEKATQKINMFEVSALNNKGLKPLLRWIKGEQEKKTNP